jgi:very-short-patch-repair endonuclease
MLAAMVWAPEGTLTGRAAARLTFWPNLAVSTVGLSIPAKRRAPRGMAVVHESIPPELTMWRGPYRLTTPALTALDLVLEMGGAGIDRALLARSATLEQMHIALDLTPRRLGNGERRRLLHDSRDEPWSEAERLLHALLRAAGISGWRANVEVHVDGTRMFLDVEFDGLMLAIEVDGYEVHGPHQWEQFQRDRRRWSMLTAAGWRILHFTWHQLRDEPDWVVARIVSSIDHARSERGFKAARTHARGRFAT